MKLSIRLKMKVKFWKFEFKNLFVLDDVRNQNDIIEDRNFGDFSDENEKIGLESQDFPAKYVEGEYEVGHWEKKLTPKSSDLIHKKIIEGRINSQKNKNSEEELNEAIKQDIEHYDNKANINQKIKNRVETLEMNSESHETQPKKINIGTNKATFSGEIGDIYWDYPVEKD